MNVNICVYGCGSWGLWKWRGWVLDLDMRGMDVDMRGYGCKSAGLLMWICRVMDATRMEGVVWGGMFIGWNVRKVGGDFIAINKVVFKCALTMH